MTIIYITEGNCECYGVTFENNECVKVQKKVKDILNDENTIYCVKPLEIILRKSRVWDMIRISGDLDKSVFDGNTILLRITKENDRHRYVYNVGNMVCSFLTNDDIYE